jgi:hypothetical protein
MINLITLPFQFLRWTFTNGWKGIIVLVVVIVILLTGFFVIRGQINASMNNGKPAATQIVQNGLPTLKQAPYEVSTWSRIYYAAKAIKNKDGTTTMTDYWQVINKKWDLTRGTLILDESFGVVTITKRK